MAYLCAQKLVQVQLDRKQALCKKIKQGFALLVSSFSLQRRMSKYLCPTNIVNTSCRKEMIKKGKWEEVPKKNMHNKCVGLFCKKKENQKK